MSVLIKGMEMPTTGLYFVSVDNTNWRDKTIITVERMLGNRDVRQIVGSFELIPVPPHGRLIDGDELHSALRKRAKEFSNSEYGDGVKCGLADAREYIKMAATIIPAEEGET